MFFTLLHHKQGKQVTKIDIQAFVSIIDPNIARLLKNIRNFKCVTTIQSYTVEELLAAETAIV